jgi:hypothetical protein
MRIRLHVAWLVMLLGCAGQRPGLQISTPATPGGDEVYVRVPGLPDVELIGPDGRRIRASKGAVLQNDFGGQAEAYSVLPNTQIALLSPLAGTWQLRVRVPEDRELWVAVTRSLGDGKRACDAADTMRVKENDARSWNLRWSAPNDRDTCWIQLARAS